MSQRRIPALKDVMTPFPHFIEVGEDTRAARELMQKHGIRHLPIKKDSELVGVVTERDLKIAAVVSTAAGVEQEIALRELCDTEPYVVELHVRMDEVVREMARRRVDSAMVVRDGRLAGIVTATDVCRAYAELLLALDPPADEPA
ncbi:MAG: CBS domain-containing protein [Myxococcales bacterium]|nr:CBS domain-containing protein [Myxococcales bacterium]